MLYLKELTPEDGRDVYEMLQGIVNGENGVSNKVEGMDYSDFPAWLKGEEEMSRGIGLPEGYVPQKTYWLYDGDTPVGQGKVRLWLTDALRREGGTLGYAVAKPYRGRGYGTALMGLLVEKAKELGVEDLLATVWLENIPSRRACEANGAKLVKEDEKHAFYRFS